MADAALAVGRVPGADRLGAHVRRGRLLWVLVSLAPVEAVVLVTSLWPCVADDADEEQPQAPTRPDYQRAFPIDL